MVKYRRILLLCVVLPSFLSAGEFSARVSKTQVGLDENIPLYLTLKDVTAQSAPSFSGLKKTFTIRGQHQRSNIAITNGSTSSSLTWVISLQPQQEGDVTIPSISINTSEGILTTDPIRIHVTKKNSSTKVTEEDALTLTVKTSSQNPYKNEPFFLTVMMNSTRDLLNIKPPQFSIENAMLELSGQPRIEKHSKDGIKGVTVTFTYLVTPMQAGPLHIPSISLEGATPVPRNEVSRSFFDQDFDSTFFMSGFERLQPFKKTTTPLKIDVQPAVSGMDLWLPARHIALEETWDSSQKLEVGEPITRVVKIVAEGVLSNQLPDLSAIQGKDGTFKVYADKPVTGNEIKENTIHSYRLEQYTLIPQQAGQVVLPEITLEWWDVAQNKKAVAVIPPRIIKIAPKITDMKNVSASSVTQKDTGDAAIPLDVSSGQGDETLFSLRDVLLYSLVICLIFLLIGFMAWVVVLQKRISQGMLPKINQPSMHATQDAQQKQQKPQTIENIKLTLTPKPKLEPKEKKEKLPDLNPT